MFAPQLASRCRTQDAGRNTYPVTRFSFELMVQDVEFKHTLSCKVLLILVQEHGTDTWRESREERPRELFAPRRSIYRKCNMFALKKISPTHNAIHKHQHHLISGQPSKFRM